VEGRGSKGILGAKNEFGTAAAACSYTYRKPMAAKMVFALFLGREKHKFGDSCSPGPRGYIVTGGLTNSKKDSAFARWLRRRQKSQRMRRGAGRDGE